jgi:hypothetical protein
MHQNGIDIIFSLAGVTCWMVVGLVARDKPLWIVNAFSVIVLGASLFG